MCFVTKRERVSKLKGEPEKPQKGRTARFDSPDGGGACDLDLDFTQEAGHLFRRQCRGCFCRALSMRNPLSLAKRHIRGCDVDRRKNRAVGREGSTLSFTAGTAGDDR